MELNLLKKIDFICIKEMIKENTKIEFENNNMASTCINYFSRKLIFMTTKVYNLNIQYLFIFEFDSNFSLKFVEHKSFWIDYYPQVWQLNESTFYMQFFNFFFF